MQFASRASSLVVVINVIILKLLELLPSAAHAIAFDEISTLHIWITVSSLANRDPTNSKSLLFRQIELNWINAPLDDPSDHLSLYLDGQPGESRAQLVSVHKLNGRMNGKLTTDHYLPMINFINETQSPSQPPSEVEENEREVLQYEFEGPTVASEPGAGGGSNINKWHQYNTYGPRQRRRQKSLPRPTLQEECIGYCVAYHSQGRVLATNCLRTNPNWMRDTQATLRSLPSLMIPGTHNSGTYPRQLDKSALQIINKYQINQEESIFNQLLYGIRYLDLRVGFSKVRQRPEELWIYHDIFRTDVSVNEVFEQVARFLDLTTHEIVVMDFHRFTVGFQNEDAQVQRERHAKLIDSLFNQLGHYIIPSYLGQHAPLNEYISMGKRLIVGYAERAQLLGSSTQLTAEQQQHHASMFGLYSAAPADTKNRQQQQQRQQARGDFDGANSLMIEEANSTQSDKHNWADTQLDRRMGTRIYNKLKSFKLISRQFSKRSIEDRENSPATTTAASATTKYRQLVPRRQELKANRKEEPILMARLLQAGAERSASTGATSSPEEALASLSSRLALLFAPVRHLWPNKDTLDGLAQYMNETTCRKYFGELRSMMVELTPTVFGAISDKYDGNRRLADLANRPVTDWIRQRWLHCLNIVASDFFLGNDLIRLSIYANKMRLSNNHRHGHVDDLSLPNASQQCQSFRRVGHLLDKSRLAAAAAANHQHNQQQSQQATSTPFRQTSSPEGISDLFSFFKRVFNL